MAADEGKSKSVHSINQPLLNLEALMPRLESNGLRSLSLFSGGGGLDLGFDLAGFEHVASYELIPICKDTLQRNRPEWNVYAGPDEGDVSKTAWERYKGMVDIIQGGPPCQPFSVAGSQKGEDDERNMWGEFNRAVNTIKPRAFVAENVLGLLNPKFDGFVQSIFMNH
ncbi:DNA cytosine methyltransferase [Vibrio taketomensis]|uniref:DNA cytosine methyltransferase n=1 Tax=Vibrio taketomensis TaxID=2572923 RepID=UPI0018D89CA5|nr:DNA cytosine methyltransferase [Vibrio taketomensis]